MLFKTSIANQVVAPLVYITNSRYKYDEVGHIETTDISSLYQTLVYWAMISTTDKMMDCESWTTFYPHYPQLPHICIDCWKCSESLCIIITYSFIRFCSTSAFQRLVVSFKVNEVLRRADWQLFLPFFADTYRIIGKKWRRVSSLVGPNSTFYRRSKIVSYSSGSSQGFVFVEILIKCLGLSLEWRELWLCHAHLFFLSLTNFIIWYNRNGHKTILIESQFMFTIWGEQLNQNGTCCILKILKSCENISNSWHKYDVVRTARQPSIIDSCFCLI